MVCNPEDCGYCRKGNPEFHCDKLGLELKGDARKYSSFYCSQ
jgi:hypothetical protein